VRRLMAKKYGGEDKLNRVVKARLAKEQEKPAASIFPTSQKASFIKFCSARGASYGCFSTFSMHPFTMGGKQWPTVVYLLRSACCHRSTNLCFVLPLQRNTMSRAKSLQVKLPPTLSWG